ncbi:MAG: O-antigen ligase family protein [Candidatus Paceibacterota bacterium]
MLGIYINTHGFKFRKTTPLYASLLYVPIIISLINKQIVFWPEYFLLSSFPLFLYQTNYYFLKEKPERINQLLLMVVIITVIASYKTIIISNLLDDLGLNWQTNWGNVLAACLPFVFLIKKQSYQIIFLLFLAIFIMIGLKRTGMISLIISIFAMLVFKSEDGNIHHSLTRVMISIIILFTVSAYLFNNYSIEMFDRSMHRVDNLAVDGGSGRKEIYLDGISSYKTSVPVPNRIIGFGYGGFTGHSGRHVEAAHNDILDFAYNYGIFAVFLLLIYYIRLMYILIITWWKCNKYYPFIFSSILIFFTFGNISSLYHYFVFFIPLIICLAIVETLVHE